MLTPPQRDEDRENLLSKTNISDSTCGIRCAVVFRAGVPQDEASSVRLEPDLRQEVAPLITFEYQPGLLRLSELAFYRHALHTRSSHLLALYLNAPVSIRLLY